MKRMRIAVVVTLVIGLLVACGKSGEKKSEGSGATGAGADSTAVPSSVGLALTAKGFRVIDERRVPSERSGRNASAVVYRSADGAAGGVYYVLQPIDTGPEEIGWHWHFAGDAPDSVLFTELNHDGLWDMQVYSGGGKTLDLVQGDSFWLMGPARKGTVALNGASSQPDGLWKCFDGDSTTAWTATGQTAYVEFPSPLGLEAGELSVQLAGDNRPGKVTVSAGDQKLQTVDLSDTINRQTFALDPATRQAAVIRLEFSGGSGGAISISELGIR
ncbi:MAG TPA: hypothetical protein VFX92_00795 [Candidatus Krumholzibacteria bacterium]|nr:hypothetical protein [Candidatus Krumholzibacteria bacterium]